MGKKLLTILQNKVSLDDSTGSGETINIMMKTSTKRKIIQNKTVVRPRTRVNTS